ncbi:hypothetical protein AKO1_015786 [Acrasis kona]|uniref:Uncharacterized protein n=1 Tax=Acrasis kona TaxID=1008807 RepID=A0AAW2ZFG3_9EUKA
MSRIWGGHDSLTDWMYKMDWSSANSHQFNSELLKQMNSNLERDPDGICLLYKCLDYTWLNHCHDSIMIGNYILLSISIQLLQDVPAIKQRQFHVYSLQDEPDDYDAQRDALWIRLSADDFCELFAGQILIRLIKSASRRIVNDPSQRLRDNCIWLYKLAIKFKSPNVIRSACVEIRNALRLCVVDRDNHKWTMTNKCKTNVIQQTLVQMFTCYPSIETCSILISCCCNDHLADLIENRVGHIMFGNQQEPMVEYMEKCDAIMMHVASTSSEAMASCLLQCAISYGLNVNLIENAIRSFLKNTFSEHARHVVSGLLVMSDDEIIMGGESFERLVNQCKKSHCALLLSVLIHKAIDHAIRSSSESLQEEFDFTRITFVYVGCMDQILNFVPHPNKEDFDVIYLYFMALEMVESIYWNMTQPQVVDRTEKLENLLSLMGEKYDRYSLLTSIGKKITDDGAVTNALKSITISQSTSLACAAMNVYLFQLISKKKNSSSSSMRLTLLSTGDVDSQSGALHRSQQRSYADNKSTEMLTKLKNKKAFKENFALFFSKSDALFYEMDQDEFRELIMFLFPLCSYLGRI